MRYIFVILLSIGGCAGFENKQPPIEVSFSLGFTEKVSPDLSLNPSINFKLGNYK